MASFKAGDRVRLATRELTPDDEKNGLYYSYFGGLTGVVDAIYGDGTSCVNVDLDSLSGPTRDRHLAMQEAERKKWLENLSGEARNRLSPEQKQLRLSYKILVNAKDMEPSKGPKPESGKRSENAPVLDSEETADSANKGPARAPEPGSSAKPVPDEDEPSPKRLSAEDIANAEEEYLRSLQSKT